MTEWLDIVDEHDQVIGRDTRSRIHAAGHRHRSSHILLFNTRGEVFVQLRSMKKDYGAGLWDTSAAGHVDSGESYVECAVRELQEELGVQVDPLVLREVGSLSPSERNGFEFTAIYSVCSEQPLVLQRDEIDDGRWLTPESLASCLVESSELFTDTFRDIWAINLASDEGNKLAGTVS